MASISFEENYAPAIIIVHTTTGADARTRHRAQLLPSAFVMQEPEMQGDLKPLLNMKV
jgi:hypothetical protein